MKSFEVFLNKVQTSNSMMKSFKVFLYKVQTSNSMMKSFKVFLYKVQTSNSTMKSFKVLLYKVQTSNSMMKSFKVFLYKVQTSNWVKTPLLWSVFFFSICDVIKVVIIPKKIYPKLAMNQFGLVIAFFHNWMARVIFEFSYHIRYQCENVSEIFNASFIKFAFNNQFTWSYFFSNNHWQCIRANLQIAHLENYHLYCSKVRQVCFFFSFFL